MKNSSLIGPILGAVIVGCIASDRSGHWFGGAVIGFFAGLIAVNLLVAARDYFSEAARDRDTRRRHTPIYIVIGAFVVALVVFFSLKPEPVILPPIPQVDQPVAVSGYTRSDGTQVSPYNRALPGERSANDERVDAWDRAGDRRMDAYNAGRNKALLCAFGVFAIGCFLARKVGKNAA
jgi:hypothetical protein